MRKLHLGRKQQRRSNPLPERRRTDRIRHHCPRRAQPFLVRGSSTRTKATTRARGGKAPEVRMAATVAGTAAWAAGILVADMAATAGGPPGGEKKKNTRKRKELYPRRKAISALLRCPARGCSRTADGHR